MTTSPTRSKQKLSLRKRLFVKKSPKVGCYVDADSNDENINSLSRPISPVDPFLALSANSAVQSLDHAENSGGETSNLNVSQYSTHSQTDDELNPKCCKTFFKKSRPKSLVEGPPKDEPSSGPCSPELNSTNSLNKKVNSNIIADEIQKVFVKFPRDDDPRKTFEHSGSFEGIKSKNKQFVKRLSADHLISTETKSFFRSSSPESERSGSLDRKKR